MTVDCITPGGFPALGEEKDRVPIDHGAVLHPPPAWYTTHRATTNRKCVRGLRGGRGGITSAAGGRRSCPGRSRRGRRARGPKSRLSWTVERTFGWLMFHRRLARDYEALPARSKAMIHLVMIDLMGPPPHRRIHPHPGVAPEN